MYSDYLESIQERYMVTPCITSKPDAGLLSFLLFALQKEVENEQGTKQIVMSFRHGHPKAPPFPLFAYAPAATVKCTSPRAKTVTLAGPHGADSTVLTIRLTPRRRPDINWENIYLY